MNKIIAIFLILVCLTVSASASCDVCKVTVTNVRNVTYEDEIDIFVTFRNDGTERCTYNVEVLDMDGNIREYEPDTWEFWQWIKLNPGESATVKLSSNWDFWNVCDLPGSAIGKGNYSIRIWGHNSHPTKCKYSGGTTPGLKEYYLFDAPDFCCGAFEGISCLNYSASYGGFTCNESVQINFGKDCLVYCWNDYDKNNCSCVLDAACAIKCISGTPSSCYFGDFICDGPYYSCANGDTPEVRCSTTKNCKYQCAAKCGRKTTCTRDCESCCRSITCNKGVPFTYEPDNLAVCMDACMGLCRTHEELCNIIYILGGIAVAVSVFLIMVHGVRWMTADDFEGRQDAKRGIVYVFIGLILVMVAATLASYFFTGSLVC